MTRLDPTNAEIGRAPASADDAPLCIDLDGTLVRTDTMLEALARLRPDGRQALGLFAALLRGRAVMKKQLAELAALDPASLPYTEPLIAYLGMQKARGRRLVLATASDRRIAEAVADHLDLFDEVIASDGARNLKGAAKADAIVARFGERGFVYAGNEQADVAVWDRACAAILVNTPRRVAAKVERAMPVEWRVDDAGSTLRSIVRAVRPHQWLKNLLVAVPVLTGAQTFFNAVLWAKVVLAFVAFSFVASGLYVVNDILDIAADRAHPKKRLRPFANGALSIPTGLAAAFVLLGASGLIGGVIGILPALALYVVLALSYSVFLKEQPLVDIFVLATLYTLRLVAGGLATGYHVSLWLLGFSGFFFLGLAFLKRVEEMGSLARRDAASAARRGYEGQDREILQLFGCCSAFVSTLVLALYVNSAPAISAYRSPALMWGTVPLMLFWQCRLWLSTARGYMHEDPIVYAARDWVSWLVVAGLVLVVLAAHFL